MLDLYPDFKRERINSKDIEAELDEPERNIVDRFIQYCAITAGPKKCQDNRSIVLQLRYVIGKPFPTWTLEDLRGALALLNRSGKREWTVQCIKIVFKRFLKWHFSDWHDRFNHLEDIRLHTPSTQDKFTASDLLTPDDVQRLIRAAETLRDRAMIVTLFETACRPQELRSLRWKDVLLDQEPPLVVLYSTKTRQTRSVPIHHAIVHLKRWRQEWRYADRRPQDFVFPGQKRHNPVTAATLWYRLKRITSDAGIEKNVYAYLFRHSTGSDLYDTLPEQIAKRVMGHARDSRMPAVYSHGTNQVAIQAMLRRMRKVEEVPALNGGERRGDVERMKRELREIKAFLGWSRGIIVAMADHLGLVDEASVPFADVPEQGETGEGLNTLPSWECNNTMGNSTIRAGLKGCDEKWTPTKPRIPHQVPSRT